MATVLSQLAQHVQQNPPKRQGPPPVSGDDVVERQHCHGLPRALTGHSVGGPHRFDRVVRLENERLVRSVLDAEHRSGEAGERLFEPDAFDERRMLDETQQCRVGRDQRPTDLLLGETIEAVAESTPMLVEKDMNLLIERQGEHIRVIGDHPAILAYIS
jgi:hypothetical protein